MAEEAEKKTVSVREEVIALPNCGKHEDTEEPAHLTAYDCDDCFEIVARVIIRRCKSLAILKQAVEEMGKKIVELEEV